MPKKNMIDKDVERTHKARGRTARTSPDYPAKKEAHENAKLVQAGRNWDRQFKGRRA